MNPFIFLKSLTLGMATHFRLKKSKLARCNVGFSQAQIIGVIYSYTSPEKMKFYNVLSEV